MNHLNDEGSEQYGLSDPKSIADRLLSLALARGFPKRGLSVRLSELCNVSNAAANKWVTGRSAPTKKNAEQIAQFLNTTSSYLLFGETAEEQASLHAPPPIQLAAISYLYELGRLDEKDLNEIARFARLLAEKNSART